MTKSVSSRVVENPEAEFGVSASTASEAVGAAGAGEKGKGKEEGVDLQFLDYVTCSLCGHPFYSKSEPDRKFWMTSCGHILCGSRDHTHVKGRCTRCKKEDIDTYPVDENIHPELKAWFGNPSENTSSVLASLKQTVAELEVGSLAVAAFQTQELMRLVKLLRLADERKEENIKLVKVELQKMALMKKELAETKAQLADVQARNAELIRGNDQLRSTQHRLPLPPAHYTHQINPLTPVAEEGEDEGYSDSGPASVQRFEYNLANDRGRDRPAPFDQYATPRTLPSRLTLPPTDRPTTADPYTSREARGSRSAPTRVNLEKYRLTDGITPATPFTSHPYLRPGSTRPGSAMSRPGSARPFAPSRAGFSSAPARRVPGYQNQQAEYPNFLDGLPVNGQPNVYPTGDTLGAGPSSLQPDYHAANITDENSENNYQGHQSFASDDYGRPPQQDGMNY